MSANNTDNRQITENNENKAVCKSMLFAHAQPMSTVKMTIKSVGRGSSFRLTCNITNETNNVLYNMMLVFKFNHTQCQMPRSTFAISYLCP